MQKTSGSDAAPQYMVYFAYEYGISNIPEKNSIRRSVTA
jgi:hypothetical protein